MERENEDYGKHGNNSNIMKTIVRRYKTVYPIFDWKHASTLFLEYCNAYNKSHGKRVVLN